MYMSAQQLSSAVDRQTATEPSADEAVALPRPATQSSSPRHRQTAANERQLVERLKAGDENALEAIFGLYAKKLYTVAQRMLGDSADAEEVVQDVFWTAYRKAASFKGRAQFSTWLYRLTINAALGRMRRSKRKIEIEYAECMPKFRKDGHHWVRPVPDWSDTLDEKYARHELRALVGRALEQLKPMDKTIIVLSDLEGLTDKQTAAALGLTVPAVKTRLHRARLFLRGKLARDLASPAT